MKTVLIHDTPSFLVHSFGNGWAYSIRRKIDDAEVFLQDQAATELRERIEAFEELDPNMPYEHMIQTIWDDVAYNA